jgi:hypothetical protein
MLRDKANTNKRYSPSLNDEADLLSMNFKKDNMMLIPVIKNKIMAVLSICLNV